MDRDQQYKALKELEFHLRGARHQYNELLSVSEGIEHQDWNVDADNIDIALRYVLTRINEFGGTEPMIEGIGKASDD